MAKKINSRAKGARGELELAGELNAIFDLVTRRGQQYSGIGGADVVGLPGIHIESKRVQALNVDKAIAQAITDAKPTEIPTVFHRKDRKPWLVTVRLDDLVLFAKRVSDLHTNEEGRLESGHSEKLE